MQTALETSVARKVALTTLFDKVQLEGPFAGQVFFELFDRVAMYDPLDRRFMLALPDYHSTRPDQSEAIDYAVKLIAREKEDGAGGDKPYCLTCDISEEYAGAYDVRVAYGAGGLSWVVTVWLETREDGSTFLYGEY